MKWLLILLFAAVSLRAEELVYDWNIPGFEEVIGVAQESGQGLLQSSPYFRVNGPLQPCDSTFSYACIDDFGITAGVPNQSPGVAEFNECSIGCDPDYAPFWADFPTLYDLTALGTYYGYVSGSNNQPLTTLTISVAPEPRSWFLALAGILALLIWRIRYGVASNRPVQRQSGL